MYLLINRVGEPSDGASVVLTVKGHGELVALGGEDAVDDIVRSGLRTRHL